MVEIVLLCITLFLFLILSWSYLKDKDWEKLSLLLIKTLLFILSYIVVKNIIK